MQKKTKNLIIRYCILLLIGLSLTLIYKLFLPLTLYPAYFLLKLFYNASLSCDKSIIIGAFKIEIISACVAISAYYLLLILNLTTSMKKKNRIYSLFFSLVSLLVLNILRIFILSILYINGFKYADIVHSITWHLLSIAFVIGIWFLTIKIFKIKKIPIRDDLVFLRKKLKKTK